MAEQGGLIWGRAWLGLYRALALPRARVSGEFRKGAPMTGLAMVRE